MTTQQVHISHHSGKLAGIDSISTSTLNNSYCSKMRKTESICKHCYAANLESFRPNLSVALVRNDKLLSTELLTSRQLPIINSMIFRFDSFGELINQLHFINLIAIANHNPNTIFALWTKRKAIVSKVLGSNVLGSKDTLIDKPKNLILVYSNPVIDKPLLKIPKHFDKTFNNVELQTLGVNCNQKCIDCRLCYSYNDTHIIIEKVK